jgi:Tfp pilus assembly protein PilF
MGALALAATLGAQIKTGTTGGGAPTGTPSTGTTTTSLPSPTTTAATTPNVTNPANDSRQIFISGRVMMADGSPVPTSVTIQRVCGGNPRSVAYTTGNGSFSFQWGQTQGVIQDASESAGRRMGMGSSTGASGGSGPSTIGCELRANLAGYRSDVVNLTNRTALDNNDVGIIVLHNLSRSEGNTVSTSSLLAPKGAKKSYERGLLALQQNKTDLAAKDFEKAVTEYPKYADAWLSLGQLRRQQGREDSARTALMKSSEADPKLLAPVLELGFLTAKQGKWEETEGFLNRAVKIAPTGYPVAWYTLAVANYNLKKYDDAEKNVRRALQYDPQHGLPREQYLLGKILREKQDYAGAAAALAAFVRLAPAEPDTAEVRAEIGELRKLQGEQAAK